jgi:hypothetical protein
MLNTAAEGFLKLGGDLLWDAVRTQVGKQLSKLLSGMSDAIGGWVEGAGRKIGEVLGGGPGGLPADAPLPIPGGPGGGGAGGAVGSVAGSGLTGAVSAVAAAVTAISSVIGNFQMAGMNASLGRIEESTRKAMNYLGERADGGILGVMFKIHEALTFGKIVVATEAIITFLLSDLHPWMQLMLGKSASTEMVTEAKKAPVALMKSAAIEAPVVPQSLEVPEVSISLIKLAFDSLVSSIGKVVEANVAFSYSLSASLGLLEGFGGSISLSGNVTRDFSSAVVLSTKSLEQFRNALATVGQAPEPIMVPPSLPAMPAMNAGTGLVAQPISLNSNVNVNLDGRVAANAMARSIQNVGVRG